MVPITTPFIGQLIVQSCCTEVLGEKKQQHFISTAYTTFKTCSGTEANPLPTPQRAVDRLPPFALLHVDFFKNQFRKANIPAVDGIV